MPLDPDLLLGYIDDRRKTVKSMVGGAIYDGLAARVRRGDFNTREEAKQ